MYIWNVDSPPALQVFLHHLSVDQGNGWMIYLSAEASSSELPLGEAGGTPSSSVDRRFSKEYTPAIFNWDSLSF